MKTTLVLLFLIIFSTVSCSTYHHSPWTKEDTMRQVGCGIATFIDYKQTKWLVKEPGHQESNKLLGANPKQNIIDAYFGLGYTAHTTIAYFLPSEREIWGYKIYPRSAWQWVFFGVETGGVYHNINCGVRAPF